MAEREYQGEEWLAEALLNDLGDLPEEERVPWQVMVLLGGILRKARDRFPMTASNKLAFYWRGLSKAGRYKSEMTLFARRLDEFNHKLPTMFQLLRDKDPMTEDTSTYPTLPVGAEWEKVTDEEARILIASQVVRGIREQKYRVAKYLGGPTDIQETEADVLSFWNSLRTADVDQPWSPLADHLWQDLVDMYKLDKDRLRKIVDMPLPDGKA